MSENIKYKWICCRQNKLNWMHSFLNPLTSDKEYETPKEALTHYRRHCCRYKNIVSSWILEICYYKGKIIKERYEKIK